MSLDFTVNQIALAKGTRPRPVAAWIGVLGEVKVTGGKGEVCVNATCKPLGKKLLAAVLEAQRATDSEAPPPVGTTDLKVVVAGGKPWTVATDRPLALKTPSHAGTAYVAGDLLVGTFAECAGPCTEAQIYDSGGAVKSKRFPAGGPVVQIERTRFAVQDEYGNVALFSTAGEHLDTFSIGHGEPGEADLVRVGTRLVATYTVRDTTVITTLELDAGKKHLVAGDTMYLPRCAE